MSDIALRMDHVYKKFRKGETYNSLRDLIPALTGRMFKSQELGKQQDREFWALQDISFELKKGEALAMIGRNGAGKSTALKILSRIMKPTKGQILVNGRLSSLIEVTAGFHADLTGMENIFLHGTILGMSRREIEQKLDQIIAFSGLEEFIDTPVKRYSSGMYARLGFSIAAHVDPEVMIIDEVLSVGDFVFQQRCLDRMRTAIAGGTTLLFVSHDLKAVTEVCERAVLLEHGKVSASGPTDSVLRHYLNSSEEPEDPNEEKPLKITQVRVRGKAGEQFTFESGQTAWVDIEVTAKQAFDKLAVVIWIVDNTDYEIFNTSTERLGLPAFSLAPGQVYRCTYELKLNVAHGSFGLCAAVHRYDLQKNYDRKVPAATLFVGSSMSVRGAVNCFPRVVESGISEVGAEAATRT